VLNLVTQRLSRILDIPVPRNYLDFDIWLNSDRPSKSVDAIPDLMVKMWSTSCKSPCGLPQIHWLMESASSQSDSVVMDKLGAYVRDVPELLVVGKHLIKEGTPYHSPGSKGSNVKRLRSSKRMLRVVGTKPCWISNAMGLVRHSQDQAELPINDHNHTWPAVHNTGPLKPRWTYSVSISELFCLLQLSHY